MSDISGAGHRPAVPGQTGHGFSSTERRQRRRAFVAAPVRVRGLDAVAAVPDEVSSTVNVSRTGLLFLSLAAGFHRGMRVAVTFPYANVPGTHQLEQSGSVVRVSALANGRVAVAVAFGLGRNNQPGGQPLSKQAVSDASTARDLKRPIILAVESEDSVRDSLKDYLTGEGYTVIAVHNAADARDVLNILTPALLIAQIEGEDLPGYDLCAHVKGTPRLQHIPVMLTTRSAYPSDYSSAHSLGAVVCMAKPYRQERLGHVVRLLVKPPETPKASS